MMTHGAPAATAAAIRMRREVVAMCHRAGTSHVGSCLSVVDILATLFVGSGLDLERSMDDPDRDTVILSKGHAAAALYAAAVERGLLDRRVLADFCTDGSPLIGHAHHMVPGIDVSTGSLGQGLATGVGIALARRARGGAGRVVVVLSDGECDEGSIWEAALLAAHLGLDNLLAIIDRNGLQGLGPTAEIVNLEPLLPKWKAFGWNAVACDGHDCAVMEAEVAATRKSPTCIVAATTKGHGVPFMEDRVEWHYRSPGPADLDAALQALPPSAGGGAS